MNELCSEDPAANAFVRSEAWDNRRGTVTPDDARFRYLWAERYVAWLERTGAPGAVWDAIADPPEIWEIWEHGAPGDEALAATPFPSRRAAAGVCAAVGERVVGYVVTSGALSGPKFSSAEDYALRWISRGDTSLGCGPYHVMVWDVTRQPRSDQIRESDAGWEIYRYVDGREVIVTGPASTRPSRGERLMRALEDVPPPANRWVSVALKSGAIPANVLLADELASARYDAVVRVGQALGRDLTDLKGVVVLLPEVEAFSRLFQGLQNGPSPIGWLPETEHYPGDRQVFVPWRLVA